MGPANETEVLSDIGRSKNGFTVINDGPLEVATRPKEEAVVRALGPVAQQRGAVDRNGEPLSCGLSVCQVSGRARSGGLAPCEPPTLTHHR